jgi:hypothetical protein
MAHNFEVSAIRHGDWSGSSWQKRLQKDMDQAYLILCIEPLLQDSVTVIFLDRLPTTGKKAKPQRIDVSRVLNEM